MAGGISFTKHWLSFDNSYFQPSSHRLETSQTEVDELLLLPTDKTLFLSPEFKQYSELYGRDEKIFFLDYSQAHKKMSELGAKWMGSENKGMSLNGID
jgi:L-ascorbate peroxidase